MDPVVTSIEIRTPGLLTLQDLRKFVSLAGTMSGDTPVQLTGDSAGEVEGDDVIRIEITADGK